MLKSRGFDTTKIARMFSNDTGLFIVLFAIKDENDSEVTTNSHRFEIQSS